MFRRDEQWLAVDGQPVMVAMAVITTVAAVPSLGLLRRRATAEATDPEPGRARDDEVVA
jgi:hypothetical protein